MTLPAPARAAPAADPKAASAASRREGLLAAAAGVLIVSPDTLFVRLAEAPAFSVLAWRTGAGLAAVLLWMSWRHGLQGTLARFRGLNLWAAAAGACGAFSGLGFIAAANWATAATLLALAATAPLWAALASRLLLGESLSRRSLIAILIGVAGAMVAGIGGAQEAPRPHEAWGALAALAAGMSFGVSVTCMRRAEGAHPLAMMAVGSLIGFCAGMLLGDPAELEAERWIWPVLFGGLLGPATFACVAFSARRIRSAETSLIFLAEAPLGALLVWAVLSEPPGAAAVLGGFLIMAGVGVYATGRASAARSDSV